MGRKLTGRIRKTAEKRFKEEFIMKKATHPCPVSRWLACLLLPLLLIGAAAGEDFTPDLTAYPCGSVRARTAVHDPSIIKAGDTYYLFGSHMMAASSQDLRTWKKLSNGYDATNPVWGNLFDKQTAVFDWAGGPKSLNPTDDGAWHVWAPQVLYNPVMKQYLMYGCTSSTWNTSNLYYAVSDTVTGPYTWQGALLYSGFTAETAGAADVGYWVREGGISKRYLNSAGEYDAMRWPNAIDPTAFFDADGKMWLVYGSWSGGIFLLELDPQTGGVIHPRDDPENEVDAYFGKKLLGGGHHSIEGPWIEYDANSGFYYLFVSYGALQARGGYQIRVFRSTAPDGPYTDMNGRRPDGTDDHSAYGLKLSGNYRLPSMKKAYLATGHNSALTDADGRTYLCYHTRFEDAGEKFLPLVKQYLLNKAGWPCLLPYATRIGEEEALPAAPENVAGRYFVINQGTDISDRIAEPFIVYLYRDGTASAQDHAFAWSAEEDGRYLRIDADGKSYSGVVCRMKDDAGTPVRVFSAVGANESLWGVCYDEAAGQE